MIRRLFSDSRFSLLVAVAVVASVGLVSGVSYGGGGVFRQNQVGGVFINAEGVVEQTDENLKHFVDKLRARTGNAPKDLTGLADMRMISLKGLQAAIDTAMKEKKDLPPEVLFLAGLQRIQYVFVYPEENDVVLAGPGEGWRVTDNGEVVGITTGVPVMRLDNLLAALRYTGPSKETISVSIDPTEEGYRNLQTVLDAAKKDRNQNIPALEAKMKEAFGPQRVSYTGVPSDTYFARVLFAADYRMKRYAMNLDESPVKGLGSYVEMIKGMGSNSNVNPRWWLACDYNPIKKSEDGLSFEITGAGVKCMTEDEVINEGKVQGTGKTSGPAQKWADNMNEKYEELCEADGAFGELRGMMDMCVAAAIIQKHGLLAKAGEDFDVLFNERSDRKLYEMPAARFVDPQCSFLKTRKGWIVTASGGVDIRSWEAAENVVASKDASERRDAAMRPEGAPQWWWN